jgi:RHS repeat-associated protein
MRLLARGLDGREVCFAFEEAVDQLVHEGEPNGIRVRTETDYDDFGNPVAERRYGIFDRTGDEVFIERAFDTRPQTWLLDLVASETMRDGAGNRFAEQRFFHDDRGNVERTESWLDTEDRFVVAVSQRFDGFGNLIESTDARGNRRSIAYDILLHAFPVGESLHLGARDLLMSAEYDLGFGAVTVAVDFYGQRGEYAYDALGRLESRTMPGGAGESYQYQFGSPVSLVLKRVREDAQGATFDSYSYSDGYGRPLGTKVEAEGGRWRFLQAKAYNARKLEFRSWPPFSTDAPEYSLPDPALPHEERSYDAQGRLVETRLADGSVKREEHRPLAVAIYDGNDTAAGGEPDLRRLDGLGRITSVEERNGGETYLTRYGWNARGELETVTDALGNVKRFRFDSLGRLIEVKDPDRGLRRYAYDDVGNRVRSEDAKGQVISQAYDAANRVLEKVHAGAGAGGADAAEAVYHYDEPAGVLDFGDGSSGNARNVLGRLAWVEDRSGEEHYSYDERGNIEWVLKRLRAPGTGVLVPYRTRRSYDLLNREAEIIFPDNDRLRTVRGTGSFIQRIDGGPQGGIILAAADYAPSGQPVRLRLGNGIESVYEYDAAQRLTRLRAMNAAGLEILHESLAYDQVSNVIEILDRRSLVEVPAGSPRRRTAQFAYDDLHRLTQVRYGDGPSGGRIDYVYDALGNLLVQSTPPAGQTGHLDDASVNLGALAYQGGRSGRDGRLASDPPGPHAVTGTASGRRFSYDASGNLDLLDGAALKWDFEDRLEGFTQGKIEAEYLHDHARRRVSKRVLDGRALEETVYPDPAFEIRNGSPVKYALLDGRRLARIHGMLDPTRERVQRLTLAAGWNLIAAAVESPASLRDAFGSDAAFYEARGSDYRPVDSSVAVPAGKALWVHAPAARLVVLRGRYPVAPDGRSPGPLHAWPLLEPFRPAAHLDSSASLMVYDAAGRRWLRRDPSLPSFLSDAPEGLGAAQAFWSPGELTLRPSAAAPQATVFYHQDHLGSTAAVTDAGGGLLEERAHYPFGAVRNVHRPAAAGGGAHHDFTGKERDPESGLMVMGARGYLDLAGVFLSPDPRFADAALLPSGSSADQQSFSAFLANPQMGNLYAYATRNPLKFVDPSGLEIVYSKVLRDSPVFQEALELFKSTQEGKRLLASVEQSGARVTLRAGRGWLWNPVAKKVQEWAALTQPLGPKDYRVTINLIEAKGKFKDKDDLIIDIANSIHHELRHIEGEVNSWRLREVRGVLRTLDKFAQDHQLPSAPIDPILRMGNEVHRALDTYKTPSDDPFSATFQKQAEEARLFQRRD